MELYVQHQGYALTQSTQEPSIEAYFSPEDISKGKPTYSYEDKENISPSQEIITPMKGPIATNKRSPLNDISSQYLKPKPKCQKSLMLSPYSYYSPFQKETQGSVAKIGSFR
jgi:hypothetical protein